MLIGLQAVAAHRARGVKPDCVLVEVGKDSQPDWWKYSGMVVTVVVPESEPLRKFDPRPLVGCFVVVVGERTERLRMIVQKLCQHAEMVACLTGDSPDDLGHVWQRGQGWRVFGG